MDYTKQQTERLFEQTFAYLKVAMEGHVMRIALNRPEKRNALTPVMVNELAYALAYAHHHSQVRAVVLAAEGSVFCAGADMKAFMGHTEPHQSTIPKPDGEVLLGELFLNLHKPAIAQVHADVYAGGFLLLAGCTYVVARQGVVFGLPEVKRGLFPYQVMASLLEVMPPRKVIDWCIRGYNMPVQQALDNGLVTHVAEADQLQATVNKLCEELTANSPMAINKGMEAFTHLRRQPGGPAAHHKYLQQMLMQTIQTPDAQEGIKAFKEKRAPVWK